MAAATKRKRSSGEKQKPRKKARGPAVRGDALPWKAVSLPDRLDDAEGFYTLEEIDDVEVIRDEKNHVMFRPLATVDVKEVEDGDEVGGSDAGDWEGFDDDDGNNVEPVQGSLEATAPVNGHKGSITAPKSILRQTSEPEMSDESENEPEDELKGESVFDLLSGLDDDVGDVSAWEALELSDSLMAAVSGVGFAKPTPIQAAAIPPILDGKDVIGKAVTGSGKTLAFGIPILEKWLSIPSAKDQAPTALILAPTRELAHQLHDHITSLAQGLERKPRIAKVTGGLSILKQQRQLEHVDIIIATPGRLWEVINDSQGLIERLQQLKFLVIDEADRLLSEGHFKEVEDILDTLDRQILDENDKPTAPRPRRQILVFSATFQKGLHQKLAGKLNKSSTLLNNQQSLSYLLKKLPFPKNIKPTFIDPSPTSTMAAQLHETILQCPAAEKDLYLYALLLQHHNLKTLIFANSISTVKRLHSLLTTLSLPSQALHSSMPQKSRLRSLERFHAGAHSILVATDVAARGLDIKGIELIAHYHVPRSADMYVHRSGRTARAESSGKSVLLCSPDEVVPVSRLIGKVHASSGTANGATNTKQPEIMHIEREVIKRIRPRVSLGQKIVEAEQSREKAASKDNWVRSAAEELGVDYDSEEFEEMGRKMKRGKGGGREKRRQEQASVGKDVVGAWKAELRELLSKRVNMGVSERYLAGGRVDVDALIAGKGSGVFLEGTR